MEVDKLAELLYLHISQEKSTLSSKWERKSKVDSILEAITELINQEVVKAKAIIEFNYYEHGQICQVSTLQLQPKQTTQIQLDRMPGHFITIEHKASLADTESNKEGVRDE